MNRPYVIVSCTQSLDGYIDDASPQRLLLSNDEHFAYVDAVRASVDAIFVGANTIRRDNPRLLVRSEELRGIRTANGHSEHPVKVTVSSDGSLNPTAAFFTAGPARRMVYTSSQARDSLQKRLGNTAEVIGLGAKPVLSKLLSDLHDKHITRLMVEGGSAILTQLLSAGLVDELQLATANFFVGDSHAPRFVGDGQFLWDKDNRMKLQDVEIMGDVIAATYLAPELEAADRRWMDRAFELSRNCPPTDRAYSVGAVLVGADGQEIATGYSRETSSKVHAEEVALAKAAGASGLHGATLYSTLEPCSKRVSRPTSCTQWIIGSGIARVVYALPEPLFIQDCQGDALLHAAGMTVRVMNSPGYGYDELFRSLNVPTFTKYKGE